jgi:TRAP-type C4-dicarboxylate transport system substrate-binding protein
MREDIRALNPILLENFPAMKVQVYHPTAAERASFEAPAAAARDAYMKSASPGEQALYKAVTAELTTFRGGK